MSNKKKMSKISIITCVEEIVVKMSDQKTKHHTNKEIYQAYERKDRTMK